LCSINRFNRDRSISVWDPPGAVVCARAHDSEICGGAFIANREVVVTAGKNGTLKEWTGGLEVVRENPICNRSLTSIAPIDNEAYAVASEDRCAYVVSSTGGSVDVLPTTGVITGIASMSNGDVLTACDDGFAYAFTKAEELGHMSEMGSWLLEN
jgi:WD40 repeat protein